MGRRRSREWPPDLPMVAKRVDDATDAPAIFFRDGMDLDPAGGDRSREHRVGIGDGENHPRRGTADRLRAEVRVLRRFIAQPELGAVDSQSRDYAAARVLEAERLGRSEC